MIIVSRSVTVVPTWCHGLMRASSPHHSDVFSHLPALLRREMDTRPVAELLDTLVADGWRPGQLRHRVGAAPSQGSVARDAEQLTALLSSLAAGPSPAAKHAAVLRERELDRACELAAAPVPAAPAVAAQHLARMREDLRVPARRRTEPEPRTRPSCSLCDGEGAYFVTRDVHLCSRCVAVLATGEARLSRTG